MSLWYHATGNTPRYNAKRGPPRCSKVFDREKVGSILINSEPLLNTLDHIERPEGSIYLKNTIIERIRKHKIPSLDQNGKSELSLFTIE